jgi:hypothetical protein
MFGGCWTFLQGLSYLFLSKIIHIIGLMCIIPCIFLALLILEYMSREALNPVMLAVFTPLAALTVNYSLSPDAVTEITYPSSEIGLTASGLFMVGVILLLLFYCVTVIYWGTKIYRCSARNLKKYSQMLLAACVIIGIGIPAIELSSIENIVPGLDAVVFSIAAVLFAYVFVKKPQLAFLLPFRVTRLTVIDTQNGVALFTHIWEHLPNAVDEDLFSGMLQGITGILNEALHKGNLREITLDDATLILNRSEEYNAACILVTTKATPSLRNALRAFAEDFYARFGPHLNSSGEVTPFASAAELVATHFAFVPVFD